MTKRIDAYFTSEDDAISAESSLQRFHISNTFVDTLPEPDARQTYLPIYAVGATSFGSGTTGAGGAGIGGFAWVADEMPEDGGLLDKNEHPMTHMLEIELADDTNVDDVVGVLKENNGYLLKDSSE